MTDMAMHPDQIALSADVVRDLIDTQFPRWRELSLRRFPSTGTVNAIFRLGDELAARFPLCNADVNETLRTLQAETQAAAELARASPVPTPHQVAIGAPGRGYPLPWSVQTWLPGVAATRVDVSESLTFARDLGAFISAVRSVDTRGARFRGTLRGGDLRAHDDWMETCFQQSEGLLDVSRLRELWRHFRELPRLAPDVMCHGDLVPGNVLVADGRLVGILDVGGFGPGDPALDLIAAWHLLGDAARAVLRQRLGSDDLEWARSKAWAFEQSMGAVWYYADTNPTMSLMGRRTLERIIVSSKLDASAT